MNIAVVGAGVSGLTAAYLLSRAHQLTLYEREDRLGGHAHTHDIVVNGRSFPVDTGFMVFNDRTYPTFSRLLAELGVESRSSDMSFSVRCRRCNLQYSSVGLDGYFAQRSRLVSGRHWRLLKDIFRFFRVGRRALAAADTRTLGSLLDESGFGPELARHFVLPMAGAIWSASLADIRGFPASSYLQFMANHGLLAAGGQPRWKTIVGGSRVYVAALAARLGPVVRAGVAVRCISRHGRGVTIGLADGTSAQHDAVIIATHADQALALLADATPDERDALSRFRYSNNETFLHSDIRTLPAEPGAHASWNCDLADCRDETSPVSVTYDLNRLQGHRPGRPLLCSLNPVAPLDGPMWARMSYTHPILDSPAIQGQERLARLNGTRWTWFCGAHMRYGFHEDGVVSAVAVSRGLGVPY